MSKFTRKPKAITKKPSSAMAAYDQVLSGMVELLESARHAAARTVNAVMTATYWELGRRIVEVEQGGQGRAGYGEEVLERLSADLTQRFGRGFSRQTLQSFRLFYQTYPTPEICQTLSGKSSATMCQTPPQESATTIFQTVSGKSEAAPISQTPSGVFNLALIAKRFPLPWSAYIRLLSVADPDARSFYEAEALRNGWSVRQLDRQIATQFYGRTLLSRNKAAMLVKGGKPKKP
jgi:hypothetical protein